MRKTMSGVLMLALLLFAILGNSSVCNSMLSEIDSLVKEAEELAHGGDHPASAGKMGEAISSWEAAETYLKTFMRHAETDGTYNAMREVLHRLERGEDGNFNAVRDRLRDLMAMEKISLGTIF